MIMVPCSFDQKQTYQVTLKDMTIEEAWNSEQFEQFRDKMKNKCPSCSNREYCMGGCPLMPEVVMCNKNEKSF